MRLLPLLLVLATVVGVTGLTALAVRRPFASHQATVAEARQHAGRISAAALVVGLLAGVATGYLALMSRFTGEAIPGRLGVAVISAPLAFGMASTGVVLLGELTWPRPAGDVRRARLVRRGLFDAGPRWLLRLAVGTFTAGLLLVAAGALTAGPDGRTITVRAGYESVLGAASPYAGPEYGVPTATGLVGLAALTVGALWAVAHRPALGTADERVEEVLRQASAHRVLRGATSAALIAVGGLLTVSALSLRNAAAGAASSATANGLPVGTAAGVLPWVGGVLAVVGALGMVAGLGVLAARAPRLPAETLPTGGR
ncbi:hypothetical protein [Modestobacter italicus]|uniref:hypothetical protein n=1 Tax=Modestobacter italicus (strain DSM 44449 / CECT 9708 / BC 501) TaxID=2732864 RepID=UPI001C94BCFA|nr:hypothetical protein [Modestobacter italicus]